MKYIVNAPHGEVTIGLPYGSVTLKHGETVENIPVAKLFPQYFIPINEPKIEVEDVKPEVKEPELPKEEPKQEVKEPELPKEPEVKDEKVEPPKLETPKVNKPNQNNKNKKNQKKLFGKK